MGRLHTHICLVIANCLSAVCVDSGGCLCVARDSPVCVAPGRGWYNVREEAFVTESEASATDYKDAASGKPLQKQSEESYFFRMSRYQDALVKHINDNPAFIMVGCPSGHGWVERRQREKGGSTRERAMRI